MIEAKKAILVCMAIFGMTANLAEAEETQKETDAAPATSATTPGTSALTPATSAPTPAPSAPTEATSAPTPATSAKTPVTSTPTPVTSVPTPVTSALTFDNILKELVNHSVPSLVLFSAPSWAISDAKLVATKDGRTVVRTAPADTLRGALGVDYFVMRRSSVRLGLGFVINPGKDWLIGGGAQVAFKIAGPAWLRAGIGGAAFRVDRLAHGIQDGMELPTTELAVPTESVRAWGWAGWVGAGLVFD